MGPKPTKPVVPSNMQDAVIKTKNENGLHVFTINLDANQDGHGVSPWSIVGIVVLTILCLIILKKLWNCFRRHKPWLRSNQMLPFSVEVDHRNMRPEEPRNLEVGVARQPINDRIL